jgi:hypothetical protein
MAALRSHHLCTWQLSDTNRQPLTWQQIKLPHVNGSFRVSSNIVRNPAKTDEAQQKRELDRLRTAIALVERMRQAGISCELSIDPQSGR